MNHPINVAATTLLSILVYATWFVGMYYIITLLTPDSWGLTILGCLFGTFGGIATVMFPVFAWRWITGSKTHQSGGVK